jgi:hypothetical protein
MHLAMVREDFDTGDTELAIFSEKHYCRFFDLGIENPLVGGVLPVPSLKSNLPVLKMHQSRNGNYFLDECLNARRTRAWRPTY